MVGVTTFNPSPGEITVREITLSGIEGCISFKLWPGCREAPRPAVIILHDVHGIEASSAVYARYADAIATQGMDAFLVSYYTDADAEAMKSPDQASRRVHFNARLRNWSNRIGEVVGYSNRRKESSGRVGLLGFSNGGLVAIASAAVDRRVTALVVFYGAIPRALKNQIAHLPPLLALHGDNDRIIPLSEGAALVETARALGSRAELIVYPGAGHSFDFDPTRAAAKDASDRALSFLRQQLE
jgi:carboxymethylenebutenolidase